MSPLLELPDDALLNIVEQLHEEDALCALLASCKRLNTLLKSSEAPWLALEAASGLGRCHSLSSCATVLVMRRVRQMLQPFAVKPPLRDPQKLRCSRDLASAVSAMQVRIGSFHRFAPTTPGASLWAPLTARERDWLRWYGRMRSGILCLEPFRFDTACCSSIYGTALHLHDTTTDDCVACEIEANGQAIVTSSAGAALAPCAEQRLSEAVAELRHRVGVVTRISVVDGTKQPGRRALAMLRAQPQCLCRKLDALTIEGCPAGALAALEQSGPPLAAPSLPASASASASPIAIETDSGGAGLEAAAPGEAVASSAGAGQGAPPLPTVACASAIPAIVIAEQARPRLSIGHAMDVVGSLVRQLVQHDAHGNRTAASESGAGDDAGESAGAVGAAPAATPRRVQHLVFVGAGPKATETLERAVCSIAFKSHLALVAGRS